MRRTCSILALGLFLATPLAAQDAPLFESAPAVLYETYAGINGSGFDDYFEMLAEKYAGSDGYGWGIYRQNAKVGYRITPLPNGLETMVDVLRARVESFQDFDDHQMDLWRAGWSTRHQAVYNAAPALSYVPEGFTVDDIRALPYNRVTIYHLKKDQAGAFAEAARKRAELDREAGISTLVLTVWNGALGTRAPVVMVRNSDESAGAHAANLAARMEARQPYIEEFGALSRAMNDAAWHIERHEQFRVASQSFAPGR
jgi:hypothetical protein